MRAPALALAALAALALGACETTQEKSAKLERAAKLHAAQASRRKAQAERALDITTPSRVVKVIATKILRTSESAAAVVTLRNESAATIVDAPIQIKARDAAGAVVYTNHTLGLAPALVSVPLLPAHATAVWVNDQVQASSPPQSVSVRVGEGHRTSGAIPDIAVTGMHLFEGSVEGDVVNRSHTSQRELVLYVLARRGGAIVAAGRALVPQSEAGASTRFQAFLVGSPDGARLEAIPAPTTLG